jgi:hypothetical protein
MIQDKILSSQENELKNPKKKWVIEDYLGRVIKKEVIK